MSCHDIVYLQGHDVTLENQFFLMGISTALPWWWWARGVASERQHVVVGLEGSPPRAGDKSALLWAQSHREHSLKSCSCSESQLIHL